MLTWHAVTPTTWAAENKETRFNILNGRRLVISTATVTLVSQKVASVEDGQSIAEEWLADQGETPVMAARQSDDEYPKQDDEPASSIEKLNPNELEALTIAAVDGYVMETNPYIGATRATVRRVLKALVKRDMLYIDPDDGRSYRLTDFGSGQAQARNLFK